MAFTIKINGTDHIVDVDGDTPLLGCCATCSAQARCQAAMKAPPSGPADALVR
jgi:hypothetical protein